MTQDEIIEMADKADVEADNVLNMKGEYHPNWHEVRDEIFAKLVAAKAIAELESQEPVAYYNQDKVLCFSAEPKEGYKPVYTTPPQRTEQEPVAWMVWGENNVPALTFTKPADKYVFDSLYTHPPQRTWVGLSDEEYIHITDSVYHQSHGLVAYYKAIEAKLREKNSQHKENNT